MSLIEIGIVHGQIESSIRLKTTISGVKLWTWFQVKNDIRSKNKVDVINYYD
jgi:hypothetical protein